MNAEILNAKAPCPAVQPCGIACRSVYGTLNNTDGILANNDNYINWLRNFDITTVNWGCTTYVTFGDWTDTAPTQVTANYPDGGYPYSWEFFYYSLGGLVPSDNSIAGWSQVLLGGPQAYMVLAEGFTTPEGLFISVEGCTAPLPANPGCVDSSIVTLPLPDPSIGYNCQQYLCARVGPNTTNSPTGVYPDLATFARIVCPSYGSKWNPNQLCQAATVDPITGALPKNEPLP